MQSICPFFSCCDPEQRTEEEARDAEVDVLRSATSDYKQISYGEDDAGAAETDAGAAETDAAAAKILSSPWENPGRWEAAMDGDTESTKAWVALKSSTSSVLDQALWDYVTGAPGSKRRVDVDFMKGQTCSVDFDLFTTMYNKRVIPMRRKDTRTRNQTHPSGKHHPWYDKKVKMKDAETKDFLNNDFFFKAFCQAVRNGGGEVDFEADDLFDFRFNEDTRNKKPKDAQLSRRGGVLYREPAGWKRFAIKSKGNYDDGDNTWMKMSGEDGEWAVAYHGTAMKIVPLIIKNGFKVGTGQGAKSCNDVRTGTNVGSGVFCTPNLTPVECYANGNEDGGSEQKEAAATVDGKTLFFAFQCRVNPKAIRRPDRHFARNNDEEIMGIDGVFEWIINDPKDIRPYGVLVRDKAGCDHRKLGELIGNNAWNKEHKPLKPGYFDKIPGKVPGQDAELERSYLQARGALL